MGYTKEEFTKFFGSKKSIRISILMILILTISTIPLTSVYANGNIDLTFEETNEFQQGVSYPIEDTILLEIYATNLDQNEAFTSIKWIDWSFCEGNMSISGCDENDLIDGGSRATTNIGSNSQKLISFGTFQAPISGDYTLDIEYRENDLNDQNDEIRIVITIVDEFIDFEIDSTYEIIPQNDPSINTYLGNKILNSNKNYDIFLNASVENWNTNSGAKIGWQLIDGGVIFAEELIYTSNFPTDDNIVHSISVELEPLNSPREGTFVLKYGLFIIGEDMNPNNNLQTKQVYFDNSLDISIKQPEQNIQSENGEWFAGINSISVEVENKGNLTIEDYVLNLEQMYDGQWTDILQSCLDIDLHPGETITCYFDLLNPGNTNLILSIDTSYGTSYDENLEDNQLTIPIEIIAGELNATVLMDRIDGIYTYDDTINLVAVASSYAPTPLAFEWSKNGWTLSNGENVNISATQLGIGNHQMVLTITDALDRIIFIDFEVVIVNTTFFSYQNNMVYGVAPTRTSAKVEINLELVPEMKSYQIDEDLTPLYLLDVNTINTLYPTEDPGLERLELNIDLDKLVPSEIDDFESIEIFFVEDLENETLIELDSNSAYFDSNENLYKINTNYDGLFLITATILSINISIENLNVTPYEAGGMMLTWNIIGDVNNPLVLEWNIFRISNSEDLLIPFDSLESNSDEDWEQLTQNKLSDSFRINKPISLTTGETENALECIDRLDQNSQNYSLEVNECYNLDIDQRWYDPKPLGEDMCASYVIVATNREGKYLWGNGAVTGVNEEGEGSVICGDNKAPLISLSNIKKEVLYDNSSSCLEENLDYSRCYSVKLKWNWPMIISESVSFKLYRTEQYVTNLQFAIPLMTYENIIPGDGIEYIDSGKNVIMNYSDGEFENIEIDIGIRPERVYYYYLTPIDSLGNERTVPIQGNWIEVKVDEVDVSEYHPEWIPPVPPPPETITGTEFEIELLDYLEESSFQIAGIITIIILCLNFILIPYSLQLRKKTSKRIDHMIKTGVWGSYDDEDDDY
ncbi:MAG: hypothetical protein CMB64_07325 [Euryarchaeota archaeon]|nr:hypothetical protein [Euryarchaeota archaeon]